MATSNAGASGSVAHKATDVDCHSVFLDAFVLNQHIFNKEYFIAPLNRPDHSNFLPGEFSHPDAIPVVDVDGAYPWHCNSRIADVTGTPNSRDDYSNLLRKERLGVYLHWTVPKVFRTADVDAAGSSPEDIEHGYVPDRWIVIRCITESSEAAAPAFSAFMIESNRIRHVGRHLDPTADALDVETQTSPFIDRKLPVEQQIDVFMGMKRNFDDDWDDLDPAGIYHMPLTLLDSANPMFADFQHHNAGISSIHDDLAFKDKSGSVVIPKTAEISYAVFGYHSKQLQDKSICHGSLYNVKWTSDAAPGKIQAVEASKRMREAHPVALGSDTLEALETYLHNLQDKGDWVDLIDEVKLAISQAGQGGLLDSRIPQNLRAGFKPTEGGRLWRFNNDAGAKPAATGGVGADDLKEMHVPSPTEMKQVLELNRQQAYVDALSRQEKYLRHRLFCEWWKRRSRYEGGKNEDQCCIDEANRRVENSLQGLKVVTDLQDQNKQESIDNKAVSMRAIARPEFFSRTPPSLIVGGMGTAWPSEFLTKDRLPPRSLHSLPFDGPGVKKWLEELITEPKGAGGSGSSPATCMAHGMKFSFQDPEFVKKISPKYKSNRGLRSLPAIFKGLDNLTSFQYNAPGWVRIAVDSLMQEWAYALSIGDPEMLLSPRPTYYNKADTHWNDTQPFRALFLEWEVEYYHLPKRFWRLELAPDGTADYKIKPDINISAFDMMDFHKRTISGRSILHPNAEWPMDTLVEQLLDKVDTISLNNKKNLKDVGGRVGVQKQLREALKKLELLGGDLAGFTDHLLTLHQGLHVAPSPVQLRPIAGTDKMEDPLSPLDRRILDALLTSEDGHDVTPYGEDMYSLQIAERDFKPVTHGQARFTKFNIVDKFGQVVSPRHRPGSSKPDDFYPCISRSIACQTNEAEGSNFANGVELDDKDCSQFFQLGHRINQDARLNLYFVVNSAEPETYHESTRFFTGDKKPDAGLMALTPADEQTKQPPQVEHLWRPTTEYEDPVWGWLMLDFRTTGIQVYNAEGESMGEALVPDSIHDKAYWQVYYSEGNRSKAADKNTQLQKLIANMSDAKFLVGLWAMLADACQSIYHDPMSGDAQLLNMVGRPLALVNIGMNLELATPVMETQSYGDLAKQPEITLDQYKFEVLLGDKNNLHDGLVGYFTPSSQPVPTTATVPAGQGQATPTAAVPGDNAAVTAKRPDISCIYSEFGYPGRNAVDDDENQKADTFASPSTGKVYVSPFNVDPASCPNDPGAYQRAICNHPSTVILGAIVDPFMPVHIATGILPSSSLQLPQWVIDQTLKKMRVLLRGGPVLTRGDLPSVDASAEPKVVVSSTAQGPSSNTAPPIHEACLPPLTTKGEWSWLQPVVPETAEAHGNVLPKFTPFIDKPNFVPFNLKSAPADYPLETGPHTVLEGFYKCSLSEMKEGAKLVSGQPGGAQ